MIDQDNIDFRTTIRRLRVLVPPVWPVKVRRRPLDAVHGDCAFVTKSKHGTHFRIRVDASLSPEASIFVLIHEWAHALSWGSDSHRIRNHGPEWGIAMSRIWQALLED